MSLSARPPIRAEGLLVPRRFDGERRKYVRQNLELNSLRPSADDAMRLQQRLLSERASSRFDNFTVLRRRDVWYAALPVGSLVNDFRPGVSSPEKEKAEMRRIFDIIRMNHGGTMPVPLSTRFYEVDDICYMHEHLLFKVLEVAPDSLMITAALSLIFECKIVDQLSKHGSPEQKETAGIHPVIPPKHREPVPLSERPIIDGRRARGAGWTAREDRILRMSPLGTARPRRPLTEPEWSSILKMLNERTRGSVLARCQTLNTKLKRSLMVEGFFESKNLTLYLERQLGEKMMPPRYRTRRDGSYFGPSVVKSGNRVFKREVEFAEAELANINKIRDVVANGPPLLKKHYTPILAELEEKLLERASKATAAAMVVPAATPTPPPTPPEELPSL